MGKYQLVEWSGEEFDCSEDDSIRQVTTLVEEFLNVVILVLGERHTPGVGQVSQLESIRKEVVQGLNSIVFLFYRIFFIYLRFEHETQVESRLVYLSFDLYIFALSSVFN